MNFTQQHSAHFTHVNVKRHVSQALVHHIEIYVLCSSWTGSVHLVVSRMPCCSLRCTTVECIQNTAIYCVRRGKTGG